MRRGDFQSISFMKSAKLLLISLISLAHVNCEEKLKLLISVDTNNRATVQPIGTKINVINDAEAQRFGLQPNCLDELGFEIGKLPDRCYLSGEIHKSHDWPEVTSIYEVQNVIFVSENTEEVRIHRKIIENDQNFETTVKVTVETEVLDSVGHQNTYDNTFNFDAKVEIGFRVAGTRGFGEFSYQHEWGSSEKKTHKTVVGARVSVETVVGPYSNLTVELRGIHKSIVYEVTYRNYLTGCVVAKYYTGFLEKDYYCVPVVLSLKEYYSKKRWHRILAAPQIYTERVQIDLYSSSHTRIIRHEPEFDDGANGNQSLNALRNIRLRLS